ncbi:hypothetical protein ACLGI4_10645 [Streptomyces sp. HMX112]|uniref:hypothetical protein n=1 Tax=Streptomyces sp. HMX112 TaxID=3390850 RepID=UPI003A803F6A
MTTDRREDGTGARPRTAREELLDEFEEAELRLDDGAATEHDGEAADSLTPSRSGQASARENDEDE